MPKCYCEHCNQETRPLRKFKVTVWERVVRCVDVEVVAANDNEAKRKAKAQYANERDEIPSEAWEEDRESCRPATGKVGRPISPGNLTGSNTFIGLEIEEAGDE